MALDDDPVLHTARVVVDGTREHARARGIDAAGERFDVLLTDAGVTPEHLLGAAYATCLASSIATVARRQKVEPDDITVVAATTLYAIEEGFTMSVALDVTVRGFDAKEAIALTHAAHAICPYAHSGIPLTMRANGLPV